MINFENEIEKEFWMGCIRHAENLDARSGTTIEAKWHSSNYIEYADEMLRKFRQRSKTKD